jgi:hypothetical protein
MKLPMRLILRSGLCVRGISLWVHLLPYSRLIRTEASSNRTIPELHLEASRHTHRKILVDGEFRYSVDIFNYRTNILLLSNSMNEIHHLINDSFLHVLI